MKVFISLLLSISVVQITLGTLYLLKTLFVYKTLNKYFYFSMACISSGIYSLLQFFLTNHSYSDNILVQLHRFKVVSAFLSMSFLFYMMKQIYNDKNKITIYFILYSIFCTITIISGLSINLPITKLSFSIFNIKFYYSFGVTNFLYKSYFLFLSLAYIYLVYRIYSKKRTFFEKIHISLTVIIILIGTINDSLVVSGVYKSIMLSEFVTFCYVLISLFIFILEDQYKQIIQKNLNNKLEETIKELQKKEEQLVRSEKLAVIGEMASKISHEIKNPISAILTTIQLLKIEMEDMKPENFLKNKKEILEDYEAIEAATKQAKDIVYSTLDYTRIELEDVGLVCLNKIIKSSIILIRKDLQVQNINIEFNAADTIYLKAKRGEITQILLNLIINAKDAIIERNNSYKDITINLYQEDKMCVLEVKDTGIGMTEETRNKIFNDFFTTKEKGKGTGIGMGIVKDILDKYNATMNIESEYHKGSKFIISIPIENI